MSNDSYYKILAPCLSRGSSQWGWITVTGAFCIFQNMVEIGLLEADIQRYLHKRIIIKSLICNSLTLTLFHMIGVFKDPRVTNSSIIFLTLTLLSLFREIACTGPTCSMQRVKENFHLQCRIPLRTLIFMPNDSQGIFIIDPVTFSWWICWRAYIGVFKDPSMC